MKTSKTIILLFCGIVFGLAAFPVFAQKNETASEIIINRLPMKDFAEILKAKIENNEVDLNQPFKVVFEGFLTNNGKFDRQKSKFTVGEGDAKIVNLVKQAIEAVSDSGWFEYVRVFDAEQIKLTVAQDDIIFSTKIELETRDESRAKTMGSGIITMLRLAIERAEKRNQKTSKDEAEILKGFRYPTVNGKTLTINFALPKQTFKEMLLRSLPKANNNQTGE